MSDNDSRSFSPTQGLTGAHDHTHVHLSDREVVQDNFPPLHPRSPRINGDAKLFTATRESLPYRTSSSSEVPARQPINDAVASAFHKTDSSMSPELIQMITQNVIQQLQAQKPPSASSAPGVQPNPVSSFDQSDTTSSFIRASMPGRVQVYTPPSPHQTDEQMIQPKPIQAASTNSRFNAHGYGTARKRDTSPFNRGSSEEAAPIDSGLKMPRPETIRRTSTDPNATVLEKHWGRFFDENGQSTDKLTTFLRGVAVHLIEDCEPKHSLVVTPDKMQNFYEETRLEEQPEVYPWQHIFDDKTSSISRLLRESDVKVQHHLVQKHPDARPDIPGLTPLGFATWMTLMIRAHPDHEYERLNKILRMKGINDPDDRTLRFPAALSRRLFPFAGDEMFAKRLAELMATHCKVNLSSRNNSTAIPVQQQPPISPRKGEAPPPPMVEDAIDESERDDESTPVPQSNNSHASFSTNSSSPRRFRDNIYPSGADPSAAPSEASYDEDTSDVPTPQPPFERERKPYVAKAGLGKTYDVTSSGDENSEQMAEPQTDYLRRTKSVSNTQRPRIVPPPIAIHQGGGLVARETPDSRARSTTITGTAMGTSIHRTPSNSSYSTETRPARRSRSNSTYATDTGRYIPQRSPSYNQAAFFDTPRSSAPDSVNYPAPTNYQTMSQNPTNGYRPPPDRYDLTPRNHDVRDQTYKDRDRDRSRDRERDYDNRRSRTRQRSTAGAEGRPYPEEYYRQQQAYANGNTGVAPPAGVPYQYPPTSYKDSR